MMTLSATTFLGTVMVIGPATPPTPQIVLDILRYGNVEKALLTPAVIEELCLTPEGLEGLRKLKHLQYAGAPLSAKAGEQLIDHVAVTPAIESTEAGGYPIVLHGHRDTWDHVRFQKHAGAEFEHFVDDLYELVFVKRPECALQQIFHIQILTDSRRRICGESTQFVRACGR